MSKDCTTLHWLSTSLFSILSLWNTSVLRNSPSPLGPTCRNFSTQIERNCTGCPGHDWSAKPFQSFCQKQNFQWQSLVLLLPVHEKRMPRANPLQERLLLTRTHFCSTLTGPAPQEEHIGLKGCHFYWDNARSNIVGKKVPESEAHKDH